MLSFKLFFNNRVKLVVNVDLQFRPEVEVREPVQKLEKLF